MKIIVPLSFTVVVHLKKYTFYELYSLCLLDRYRVADVVVCLMSVVVIADHNLVPIIFFRFLDDYIRI